MARKNLLHLLVFALAIIILIGVLRFFNWLPGALQEGAMRRYASVDEVRSVLRIKDVYVPAYFPQNFRWPPSEVLAQSRPFDAVVMAFDRAETGDAGLIIMQSASKHFVFKGKINLSHVQKTSSCTIKGRDAVLESGFCPNNEPCSRIAFQEKAVWIEILMKSPEHELIIVAESMLTGGPE
jgi:hypothetical protein